MFLTAEVLDIKASEVKGIFTSDRKVVIIPCKKPPKQIDVREWVQRKLGMEGKEKSLKGKKNVIKSPNATGKQVKVAPDSPIFRTPGDPKKDGKIAPKESDASILQSPCFSPTTDTSALSTRPVSSTPMIAKKKAPLRLPITPGIANTSKPKVSCLLTISFCSGIVNTTESIKSIQAKSDLLSLKSFYVGTSGQQICLILYKSLVFNWSTDIMGCCVFQLNRSP